LADRTLKHQRLGPLRLTDKLRAWRLGDRRPNLIFTWLLAFVRLPVARSAGSVVPGTCCWCVC